MLQPSFAFQPICTLMQRSPFKQFVANKSIRTWTENQKTKPDKCTQSNENHSWHCGCYVAASHDAAASLNALKVVLKNNKTTLGTHSCENSSVYWTQVASVLPWLLGMWYKMVGCDIYWRIYNKKGLWFKIKIKTKMTFYYLYLFNLSVILDDKTRQ